MENKNSQSFGGEQFPEKEMEIFSGQKTGNGESFISGATRDMEREMGVKALDGIEELAERPIDTQANMAKILSEGGTIAVNGEGDERTEKGIDKLVEEAEKSSERTKGRPGDKEGEYQKYRDDVLQSLGHYSVGGSD